MRGRAEAEVRTILPVAEVVAAFVAGLGKVRDFVACVAVCGERRRHEVVHSFRRLVIWEIELAHFVLPPKCRTFFEL